MPDFQHLQLNLAMRSCRYTLPDDLRFVTLVRAANGGTTHIRFARGPDTTLDIPLSARTLSALIQATGHMFGTPPDDLPQAVEEYQKQGGPVVDEML